MFTALQAGQIAFESGVRKLIIGHFSSRYRDEQLLLREAQSVFNEVALANEGMRFSL